MGGPGEFSGREVLGRPEQWAPSEQVPRATKYLQFSIPPHSCCLRAGSLKGLSQRRTSLRKHLVPLALQRKPAGQQ